MYQHSETPAPFPFFFCYVVFPFGFPANPPETGLKSSCKGYPQFRRFPCHVFGRFFHGPSKGHGDMEEPPPPLPSPPNGSTPDASRWRPGGRSWRSRRRSSGAPPPSRRGACRACVACRARFWNTGRASSFGPKGVASMGAFFLFVFVFLWRAPLFFGRFC